MALPLCGQGSGQALQAVGAGAWEKRTSDKLTLRARQRSLDTELLCNEVCGRLCQLKGKKFIYCFDWGCHVIDVCHSSGCLSGVSVAIFQILYTKNKAFQIIACNVNGINIK